MKYFLLVHLTTWLSFAAVAQPSADAVDRRISSISDLEATSTSGIAGFIKSNFDADKDKVRAAYTWVVQNIRYDTDSMYAINWNMGGSLKVTESLRRRKGVCDNFSSIFIEILQKAGLSGVTIDGYTKQNGLVNKSGHTWAAVRISDTWYLFDPTWDKDRMHDYSYFMINPKDVANSHMPFDPLWQFTDGPITHRAFRNGTVERAEPIPQHVDSIEAFMRLGELDKLQAAQRRMQRMHNGGSDLLRNRMAFLTMQIATIYEERDMQLYNAAVADLNLATAAYNKFVLHLNKSSDATTVAAFYDTIMFPATTYLARALERVADLGKCMPNFQYDPTTLKLRIEELDQKIRLLKPPAPRFTKS